MKTPKYSRRCFSLLAVTLSATACTLYSFSGSIAAKGKPGGGGGGGTAYPNYVIVDLGAGGIETINDFNELVGARAGQANYWMMNESLDVQTSFLPDPNGLVRSLAEDLNLLGEAVGHGDRPHVAGGEERLGLYWRMSGEQTAVIELSNPVTGYYAPCWANSLSDTGLIVGHFESWNQNAELLESGIVVWQVDDNDQPRAFQLASGGFNYPSGIVNNAGLVCATARYSNGEMSTQPLVWQLTFDENGNVVGADSPIALGTLGGTNSDASAIDDFGNIAGTSSVNDGESHAVLWNVDDLGTVQSIDLGKLKKTDDKAEAIDFNSDANGQVRQVIGNSGPIRRSRVTANHWDSVPFIWQDGKMADLNSLVSDWGGFSELSDARAINQDGWISGIGIKDGTLHSYVAIPVP